MSTPLTARMWSRRLALFALGSVLTLLALEGVVRVVEANSAPALRWYDASTQLRVEQLAHRQETDVVFAGTSMAWQGFVPAQWTANDQLGRSAFNVALAGGVPQVMEPWLTEEVEPALRPDLVVWGLSSLDVSAAYGADNLDRYSEALAARGGWLARIEQAAADRLALVRYRNVLRDPGEWRSDRGFDEAQRILGDGGERRDFTVDDSAARRRQIAARVTDFAIDPEDIAAIHRTVARLRESGTEVVFVHMPVPLRFVELLPRGASDIAMTRRAIERLGELLDVDVYDAAGGFTDGDFVDFTHLDEASAAELTARVARSISGADADAPETIVTEAELLGIANELAAMADISRSALTQTGSLPASSELWRSSIEYGRTRDLWAYAAEGTSFDTVFVGSSMAYAAFSPTTFTAETGDSSYNASLPGAGPEEVAAFMDDVVLPAAKPRRVVIGIAPRDFTALRSGDSCVDALGGYRRARTVRDGAFREVDWFDQVTTRALLLGDPVEHDPIRAVPMLARYRRQFAPLGERLNYPKFGAKKLEREAAKLEERLSRYEFCQERLDVLAALVGDLDERGIETVVVALPLSSSRVDPLPGGRAALEEIIAATREATLSAGARQFVDLKDLLRDDQFYDLTHTDREASHQVTRAVAAALVGR